MGRGGRGLRHASPSPQPLSHEGRGENSVVLTLDTMWFRNAERRAVIWELSAGPVGQDPPYGPAVSEGIARYYESRIPNPESPLLGLTAPATSDADSPAGS